jgi:hypothetical protein
MFVIASCNDKIKAIDEIIPVDSLVIQNFASPQDISGIYVHNDSQLVAFDNFHTINLYTRNKNAIYQHSKSISLNSELVPEGFFAKCLVDTSYYIFCEERTVKLDRKLNPGKTYNYRFETPFLKSGFRPVVTALSPLIIKGDTLIFNYNHNRLSGFSDFYREKSKMKFILKNDSISAITTFFEKPVQLKYFDADFPYAHFLLGEKIYQMYGNLDTIYIFNLRTGFTKKHSIGNPDYVVPEKSDTSRLLTDPKYNTKYFFNNFNYHGMFYNPNTEHILIFYSPPIESTKDKNPTSKKIKALILNKDLQIIEQVSFKENYVVNCGILIKNKGIALPIYHSDLTNEKTTFHIFNL